MTSFIDRQKLLQIGLLVLLVVLAGRILLHGLAEYYLQQALEGDKPSVDSVLSWYANDSKAAYLKAKTLETIQPEDAEALLHRAIIANPADVRPLTVLARILAPTNKLAADNLITLASSRMPANKSVHLRAANYWIERQQLAKALHAWHRVLTIDPGLGKQLFPVFLRVLEKQEIQHFILPYALEPPSWWEHFVTYTVRTAHDTSVILRLHEFRNQSSHRLSDSERKLLVNRYIKGRQWQQAYLAWVEGLSASQRGSLATVYDGSFERVGVSQPFGWQLSSTRYTEAIVRRTVGVDGESALRVKFDNEEIRYRPLYQYLLLPPGDFKFTATKRTDKLSGRGRLKWFVRCSDSVSDVAGESRAILPSMEWEKMQFQFSVPSNNTCDSQTLSLETVGKHAFDHKLSGALWIDNIHIERHPLQ